MRKVFVRYKVKPERVAENEELVHAVYAELRERKLAGLSYATFKAADGVTFYHLAMVDGDDNPLGGVQAFTRFQADLRARCDEPPAPVDLSLLAAYQMFGG